MIHTAVLQRSVLILFLTTLAMISPAPAMGSKWDHGTVSKGTWDRYDLDAGGDVYNWMPDDYPRSGDTAFFGSLAANNELTVDLIHSSNPEKSS